VYLGDEAQAQIRDKFNADGSVLLHAFLKPDIANKVREGTGGTMRLCVCMQSGAGGKAKALRTKHVESRAVDSV
jgi:hypothetical protein